MSEKHKTKLLLTYCVAGAFVGASIWHYLETNPDKFKLLRVCTDNVEYSQKNGIKYMTTERFRKCQIAGDFYWIAESLNNEPLFGILKEDMWDAFEDTQKVSYLFLPLSDCICLKRKYPDDIFLLTCNEWNEFSNEESEDTQIMRRESDYFIDTVKVKELELLEKIRMNLLN